MLDPVSWGLACLVSEFTLNRLWNVLGYLGPLSVLVVSLTASAAVGPQRVLSGSLASDEIAVELLGRAHSLGLLLAVSTLADDPLYSNIAPVPTSIKSRFGADLEGALALRPDLVILASFNKPETLERFKTAKVATLLLGEFRNFDDIEAHIVAIGTALHVEREAEALKQQMVADLAALKSPAPKNRPLVLDFHAGGTVSGEGTLFDALVRAAGGTDLATKNGWRGWPAVGAETLATLAPDVIVAAGKESERLSVQALIRQTPGWKDMSTAKTARLVLIPERELSATSHHVVKAAQRLNKMLLDGWAP